MSDNDLLFGYARKQLDERGLLELREIAFQAGPEILREIAAFLNEMASDMEQGGFRKTSHMHIETVMLDWKARCSKIDIIVTPPPGEYRGPVRYTTSPDP